MVSTLQREMPSESTSLHRPHRTSKKNQCLSSDGFTVISSCFLVLSVTVTVALVAQIEYGGPEVVPHGAIATDDRTCSEIGMSIMRKGGTAVDVTIASLLCLTVTHPHVAGVGGGGVILIHDHKRNETTIHDFMSSPPLVPSRRKEFVGSTIGVPGFLKGLENLHAKYGYLQWETLVLPSVALARNGFKVSSQFAKEIEKEDASEIRSKLLNKGIGISEGQLLQREKYALFLEDLAFGGSSVLYSSRHMGELLDTLSKTGSTITEDDLALYQIVQRDPVQANIRNYSINSAGLPFGGGAAIAGLHHLQSKISATSSTKKIFDSVIEAMNLGTLWLKNAVQRFNGSNDITMTDMPATQLVAVDAYDLYVSAIVGLGSNFGSKIITEHEIILNNHLYDAYIFDGRPVTPYTPVAILNSKQICGQRLMLSSGSSSASLQVMSHYLLKGLDMSTAIVQPRLAQGKNPHNFLVDDEDPSGVRVSGEIRNYLLDRNYTIDLLYIPLVVNGIYKVKDTIVSHSDTRGGGVAARLDGIPGDDPPPVIASSIPSEVTTIVVPENNSN